MKQPRSTLPTRKVLLLQCHFVSSSPSTMHEQCAKDNLLKWKSVLGWSHFMDEEPEAQRGKITRPPSNSTRAQGDVVRARLLPKEPLLLSAPQQSPHRGASALSVQTGNILLRPSEPAQPRPLSNVSVVGWQPKASNSQCRQSCIF